jgi:hypothetical protein
MTLEITPKDATHWSPPSLARQLGMSQSAISRIWRAFGLKPHLVDTFKLSTDKLSTDPPVHRHGPRRGRAIPEPARGGAGAVRG